MIAALLLATTLAAPPDPAPAAAGNPVSMNEKISLDLRDASVKDVLEKIAVLLDATPIFEKGIEGKLSVSMVEQPIRKVIEYIEKAADLRVTLQVKGRSEPGKAEVVQRRLLVTHAEPGAAVEHDFAALDRELLADPALAHHRKGEKPDPSLRSDLFEFRSAGERATTWKLPFSGIASVEIPGCAEPVRVAALWKGDGVRLAFPGSGDGSRIERPGSVVRKETPRRVALPGCKETFTVTQLPDGAAVPAREARRDAFSRDQFMVTPMLFEVTAEAEKVISAPNMHCMTGSVWSMSSAAKTGAIAGSEFLYERTSMWGQIIERTATDVLLALSIAIDREIEPAAGEPVVVVRRAESDQLLRVPLGQKERVTLSPAYGGGGSALVMDLTVTPMEPPAR